MKIVDTTFLVDLSRNEQNAVNKSLELDKEHKIFCAEVSIYEMILGVYAVKGIDHNEKLQKLETMFSKFNLLPLDHASAIKAGQIAGTLAAEGKTISDTDCMIAGIALSNGISTIITRNRKHFERIKGLTVEEY